MGVFPKRTEDGPFDIDSGLDSRIRHDRRIGIFSGILAIAMLAMGLSNVIL